MDIRAFQHLIERLYGPKDQERGLDRTFMWFTEEVGELARALLHKTDRRNLEREFADVFAWLVTLASIAEVDMQTAIEKYVQGCPRCQREPCICPERGQPS